MEFKSTRSKIELRENEIVSDNKSFLRGQNTQTIKYSAVNKIELLKWSVLQFIFYGLGISIFGLGFSREESIGGGMVIIHNNIDDWVILNITIGSIAFGILIILGLLFNSKYGKNVSVYLRYNLGSKKIMRSIFTSEDTSQCNQIIEEIKKRQ